MNLTYNVEDKPQFGKVIVFAIQQVLAILAATIAVPSIVGNGLSQSAALFGAGVGTIVYLLFTRFKSPVFLGSSFAFIPSMFAAFAGGVSMQLGFLGLIIGAAFAALVYVIIAIIVKFAGVRWINFLMPAVVIGPTVSIIGLSLAGNAVGNALGYSSPLADGYTMGGHEWVCLICAFVTLVVVCLCSVFGKKMMKLIPFIIGIVAGYVVALIFTLIGNGAEVEALQIIDFSKFAGMTWIQVPDFTFLTAVKGFSEISGSYIATLAVAYVPVAFVVFAEHLADHKNLSSIIGRDLTENPGLHNTLLGDGIGSFVGSIFGGCPNTTYGESIACVAISGNASVITVFTTAIIAIILSFIGPFVVFLSSIPTCVMGGVCITLYGFIAVSGLKMLQKVDLNENSNLFTASTVFICGIGGMVLKIGKVELSEIAVALILGIIVNLILKKKNNKQ